MAEHVIERVYMAAFNLIKGDDGRCDPVLRHFTSRVSVVFYP